MQPSLTELLRFQLRFLTFRTTREELLNVGPRHFMWGMYFTWLAGMGRWWDDPHANMLQRLGIGSIVYVFVLTALLWIVVRPLKVPDWKYLRIATLIMFTSPLALVYAIPVERYVDIETAIEMNVSFLAVVAIWRVLIYGMLLRKIARFGPYTIIVTCLLPLMAIVATLFVLNLHRVVFNIMGGLREVGPHDGEYGILFTLTMLSFFGVIPIALIYLAILANRRGQGSAVTPPPESEAK